MIRGDPQSGLATQANPQFAHASVPHCSGSVMTACGFVRRVEAAFSVPFAFA
jgi:hypothetical protein